MIAARNPDKAGLWSDQRGQTTVEWILLLAVIGLPMVWVFRMALGILAEHYRMVQFVETMPFP